MNWVKFTDEEPSPHKRCDFLFEGDECEPGIWILCSVRRQELQFDMDPVYWRPPEPLPDDVLG